MRINATDGYFIRFKWQSSVLLTIHRSSIFEWCDRNSRRFKSVTHWEAFSGDANTFQRSFMRIFYIPHRCRSYVVNDVYEFIWSLNGVALYKWSISHIRKFETKNLWKMGNRHDTPQVYTELTILGLSSSEWITYAEESRSIIDIGPKVPPIGHIRMLRFVQIFDQIHVWFVVIKLLVHITIWPMMKKNPYKMSVSRDKTRLVPY